MAVLVLMLLLPLILMALRRLEVMGKQSLSVQQLWPGAAEELGVAGFGAC